MSQVFNFKRSRHAGNRFFTYDEALSASLPGEWEYGQAVVIDGTGGTITLAATEGVAKVQTTTASEDAIAAETAVWVDWNLGAITGVKQDSLISDAACTAIRIATTGACIVQAAFRMKG